MDMHDAPAELHVEHTEDSRSALAERLGLPDELAKSVRVAEIVVVPFEGWGSEERPVFAEGAEQTFKSLRTAGVSVEIATTDEDYREIALRGLIVNLGRFIVTKIGLPILIAWIRQRLANATGKAEARVEILVEERDGERSRSALLKYSGPASALPGLLENAPKSLPPTSLPPPKPELPK